MKASVLLLDNELGIRILSWKFDLNKNRWINLASMPIADCRCKSVLFNGNILISGSLNRNLMLYSIDIDSFSIIPYIFEADRIKILIHVERLYLIECPGLIYESEDEYNWKEISKSYFSLYPYHVYCSYNKGGIYIAIKQDNIRYFKFDLKEKVLIAL